MTKRYLSLPIFGLITTLAMPATAQDADTVVAEVNDEKITIGHMIIARATLPEEYQKIPDAELFPGILNQLVSQALLSQSFQGEIPNKVTLALENETRSIIANVAIEEFMEQAITEEKVKALYNTQVKDFVPADEYNASHILVETEEEALAVIAEIEGGADFAETAVAKSTGPSSSNGGNLGWFGAGAMVPEFEAAVVDLEVGGLSTPVQTQFGWHVITLGELRKTAVPSLDELRSSLENEIAAKAYQEHIDKLTADANVDRKSLDNIDPAILKDVSLVD